MTLNMYRAHKIKRMVSFELGKEIEKDVFNRLVTIVGQEKILSPHEETNLRHSETSWGLRIFFLIPRS